MLKRGSRAFRRSSSSIAWTAPFGGDLLAQCFDGRTDFDGMPPFFRRVVDMLGANACEVEGIFRLSGSVPQLERLRALATKSTRKNEVPALEGFDIHVVAGSLKQWLRELPEPLMTFDLYESWIAVASFAGSEVLASLRALVSMLPPENQAILKCTCAIMYQTTLAHEVTKMTPESLAICMAPNLIRPRQETIEAMIGDLASTRTVVQNLVEHFVSIFQDGEINNVTSSFLGKTSTQHLQPQGLQLVGDEPGQWSEAEIKNMEKRASWLDTEREAAEAQVNMEDDNSSTEDSGAAEDASGELKQINVTSSTAEAPAERDLPGEESGAVRDSVKDIKLSERALKEAAKTAAKAEKQAEKDAAKLAAKEKKAAAKAAKIAAKAAAIAQKTATKAAKREAKLAQPSQSTHILNADEEYRIGETAETSGEPASMVARPEISSGQFATVPPRPEISSDQRELVQLTKDKYRAHQQATLRQLKRERQNALVQGKLDSYEQRLAAKFAEASTGVVADFTSSSASSNEYQLREFERVFTNTLRGNVRSRASTFNALAGPIMTALAMPPRGLKNSSDWNAETAETGET